MRLPWSFLRDATPSLKKDYSQHGEQQILLRFFARLTDSYTPYFVDAGAYDGVIGSNSRGLFARGWSGMVIEPNPRVFQRLADLYKREPRVSCVNMAVSDRSERGVEMLFSIGPVGTKQRDQWKFGQVSTLHGFFADAFNRDHGYQYVRSAVDLTTLSELMLAHNSPRDLGLLSIDCEGEDLKVLKGIDLDQFRPRLLCVECDDAHRPIYQDYLQGRYKVYDHTQGNTFFELMG
jgi:FkbM family methyltransferase